MGTGGAGCVRTPACRGSGCGCGCQSPWPLIDPLNGSRRTQAQQEQRTLVTRFQSPAVFTKTMVQGPTCLANVGAGAFSTWDAVHHTFPVIGWYWVLGVHNLQPQGPKGTEGYLYG